MASGCIFGECNKCGELVWEDESFTFDDRDRIKHNHCNTDWRAKAMQLQRELDRIHSEKDPFDCVVCGKPTQYKGELCGNCDTEVRAVKAKVSK